MKGAWWRLDDGWPQHFVCDPRISVTSPGKYQSVPDAQHETIDDSEKLNELSEDDFEDLEKEPSCQSSRPATPRGSSTALRSRSGASWVRSSAYQKQSPRSREAGLGEELRERLLEVEAPRQGHERGRSSSTALRPERARSTHTRGPLALEVEFFQPRKQEESSLRCIFSTRPVGIVFDENMLPLTVATVSGGSSAHVQGVRKGMQLVRINGTDVIKSSMRYHDVKRLFEEQYAMLPNGSQPTR